ncbi:MAG: chemotaxis protein CheW [Phycisphaerales bacterium]|nr:chemotaxis protein CheW [Phycisphaerales bacterium]
MSSAVTQAPASIADMNAVESAGSTNQIVSFRLANEEYGVNIMRVQEIILPGAITEMPEVPDYICGLINLRGHVIPIVDMRKRFGLPISERDEHTRIIVVNVGSRTIGMVVDAVNEVLRISEDQLEPPPSSIVGIEHVYIKALVKFEDKLLILLDIESILSREEAAKLTGA